LAQWHTDGLLSAGRTNPTAAGSNLDTPMHTDVLTVNPTTPEPDLIAHAAEVIRRGGLVAFPTETVYGLGASALDAAAVHQIFRAKGRPATNPVIVHVSGADAVQEVVSSWPEMAARLAERFWPGPLTLVLPRASVIPDVVTAGGPTVAVRCPAHPVALALIQAAGLPIAAPSANLSTQISPTQAGHVFRDLDGRIDLLLDGGPTPGGLESTVLDLTSLPPRLLRPGLVAPGPIEAVIGPITWPGSPQPAGVPLPSPGMLARHYAPRTPLECADDSLEQVQEWLAAGLRVGWLALDDRKPLASPALIQALMPMNPAAYAATLYATLHRLDALGLDRIIVDLPPPGEDWLAIRDRLRRASALEE
jgi:L-threonylcarbamoyladenylate synthase